MLLGEHRRRHEHGGLAAVLDCLERGAKGDLRLSKADVAHQQAVHRSRRLHVGFDVVDSLHLIGRLFERKAALQLELPGGVIGIHVTLDGCPCAIQLHQLTRQVAHGTADFGFGADPLAAAQSGQRWLSVSSPDVPTHAVGLGDRDIQVVARGVVQA